MIKGKQISRSFDVAPINYHSDRDEGQWMIYGDRAFVCNTIHIYQCYGCYAVKPSIINTLSNASIESNYITV